MQWVDVTDRVAGAVYTSTAACPDEGTGEWAGLSGLAESAGKALAWTGDRWALSDGGSLESFGCVNVCGGGLGGCVAGVGRLYRIPALVFDAPIATSRLRLEVQLTSPMTEDWLAGCEPGLAVGDAAHALLVDEGFADNDFLDLGAVLANSTAAQTVEVDLPGELVRSVSLVLTNPWLTTECGFTVHGIRVDHGDYQRAPFWVPVLKIEALMDVPPGDFWTDFVNCRER